MRGILVFGSGLGLTLVLAAVPARAQQPGLGSGGGSGSSSPGISLGGFGGGSSTHYVRERELQGVVRDASGKPLPNAIVYLKNTLTNRVDTIIPDNTGAYRFDQLQFGADYQLWAQSGQRKSAEKTLSSYDTRNEITVNLSLQ